MPPPTPPPPPPPTPARTHTHTRAHTHKQIVAPPQIEAPGACNTNCTEFVHIYSVHTRYLVLKDTTKAATTTCFTRLGLFKPPWHIEWHGIEASSKVSYGHRSMTSRCLASKYHLVMTFRCNKCHVGELVSHSPSYQQVPRLTHCSLMFTNHSSKDKKQITTFHIENDRRAYP